MQSSEQFLLWQAAKPITTFNTQNSTLRFAQTAAGSGFAPQAQAYSIIPAEPLSYFISIR